MKPHKSWMKQWNHSLMQTFQVQYNLSPSWSSICCMTKESVFLQWLSQPPSLVKRSAIIIYSTVTPKDPKWDGKVSVRFISLKVDYLHWSKCFSAWKMLTWTPLLPSRNTFAAFNQAGSCIQTSTQIYRSGLLPFHRFTMHNHVILGIYTRAKTSNNSALPYWHLE